MTTLTPRADLERLRAWRTYLLAIAQAGQGFQNVLAPHRALLTPSYASLAPWHEAGWQLMGAGLIVSAALMIFAATRPAGHVLGAVLMGVLVVGVLLHGYWPGLLILACGLHLGEVAQLGRDAARRKAGG